MFEEKEYIKIYNEYYQKIFRFCRLELGSVDAEEVANNVMIVLYQKWDSIEKGEHFEKWLYSTAKICVKDKKRLLSKEHVLSHATENPFYINEESHEDLLADYNVSRLLSQLPEDMREIFELRYVKKMTIKQISTDMEIPYTTLRIKLIKAMETAKQIAYADYTSLRTGGRADG